MYIERQRRSDTHPDLISELPFGTHSGSLRYRRPGNRKYALSCVTLARHLPFQAPAKRVFRISHAYASHSLFSFSSETHTFSLLPNVHSVTEVQCISVMQCLPFRTKSYSSPNLRLGAPTSESLCYCYSPAISFPGS